MTLLLVTSSFLCRSCHSWTTTTTTMAVARHASRKLSTVGTSSSLFRAFHAARPEKVSRSRLFSYGAGMDQHALMESDALVAVDEHDTVVETTTVTKRQGHAFGPNSPRAVLHRAFSLFIFDRDAKLLLTQRAASKITFPNVWTNTCCSHPLQNMPNNEVDVWPDAYPQLPGIKRAAIRKVQHELGMTPDQLPASEIHFITRFHYWAADCLTHGPMAPWGEHEIDYILFCQLPEQPTLNLNPEEVSDYKYVSLEELKDMMDVDKNPDLLWSPWFRGIMERGGWDYWKDMSGSLEGKHTNTNIVFFEPPPAHVANYNLDSHGRNTGVLSAVPAAASRPMATSSSSKSS